MLHKAFYKKIGIEIAKSPTKTQCAYNIGRLLLKDNPKFNISKFMQFVHSERIKAGEFNGALKEVDDNSTQLEFTFVNPIGKAKKK